MFKLRLPRKIGLKAGLAAVGTLCGYENVYRPLKDGLPGSLTDHFGLGFATMAVITAIVSIIWIMTNSINGVSRHRVPDIFRSGYGFLLKLTCIPYAGGFVLGTIIHYCGPILARI